MIMKLKTLFSTLSIVMLFSLLAFVRCSNLLRSSNLQKLGNDAFTQKLESKFIAYQQNQAPEKIYLHTDKPFYYPGEDIWFSGYLQSVGIANDDQLSDIAYVVLLNPQGSEIRKLSLPIRNGRFHGDFALPQGVGGLYKIKAYTHWMKNFDETEVIFEKQLQVQKAIKPRMLLKLDFKRESYGPSSEVEAEFSARDLQDRPIALQEITYQVNLASSNFSKAGKATTDGSGKAIVRFKLPEKIEKNDGLLDVYVQHKQKTESISRSIPIVLGNITVDFFPEGGTWVSGIEGKMAFKALNEFGLPADIEGVIENERGSEVTKFKSFHQGLGSFTFKPKENEHYQLRITKPSGITKKYKLPVAQTDQYALGVEKLNHKKLKVRFYSHQPDTMYLVVQSGGKVQLSQKMLVQGNNTQTIPIKDFPVGIAKVSLFDKDKKTRCERLVFINPHKQIKVELKTAKKNYQPREKVTVDILTTNEAGKPVSANLSVAVVDDKILSLADDKQDNILSYMLMSAELKGKVYEPNFYFKPDEPKAIPALDYVMMTHGWRRYEWQEVLKNDFTPEYHKDKVNSISGQIVQTKNTSIPVKAIVYLYELAGKKRKLKITTGTDGKFTFKNVNPKVPIQLFAQSVAHYSISCKLLFIDNLRLEYLKRTPVIDFNVGERGLPAMNLSFSDTSEDNGILIVDDASVVEKKEEMIEIPVTETPLPLVSETKIATINNKSDTTLPIQGLYTTIPTANSNGIGRSQTYDPSYFLEDDLANKEDDTAILVVGGNSSIYKYGSRIIYKVNGKNYDYLERAKNFIPSEIASLYPLSKVNTYDVPQINIITQKRVIDHPNGEAKHSIDYKYLEGMSFSGVRVYRPKEYKASEQNPEKRTDFRNTIYWNPEVVTNKEGKATITFWNNDALTTFRIVAEGVGNNGHLGRAEQTFFTKLPFELTAKVPPYFSVNDILNLPVYLTNNTDQVIKGELTLKVPKAIRLKAASQTITIEPQSTQTIYIEGEVTGLLVKPEKNHAKDDQTKNNQPNNNQLAVSFKNAQYSESYVKAIEVFSKGFPKIDAYSGSKPTNKFEVSIPEVEKNTLKVELVAYPNVLGDLMDGIAAILQEPHGCFEQVSSSTYPNILALQFMKKNGAVDSKFQAKALEYIKKGYQQLAAYETSQKGFEWYGETPPHEGLSAFGLMEFLEMKKVYDGVDESMINRTKTWLLSRRDGRGGFHQNAGKYGFSGASKTVNNAYLLYALTEAGEKNLSQEFKRAYQEAQKSQDAYRTALVTLAALNLGKASEAQQLLTILRNKVSQRKPGNLKADHSIMRSGGISLEVETCALIALAEMRQSTLENGRVLPLINYIISQRSGGYFGSTQGTILALQALTKYAGLQTGKEQTGKLMVYRGKEKIGELAYNKSQFQAASLKGLEKYFEQGSQDISIRFANEKESIPFTLNVRYYAITPKSSKLCDLALSTKLAKSEINTQESIRLTSTIRNKRNVGLPSAVALIGIPSGLSVQPWQLKELQEQGKVAYYELNKNYVIFYFREMAPNATKTIALDLKAEIPGTYRAPASTAYLYYTSEFKDWQPGTSVTIKPAIAQ